MSPKALHFRTQAREKLLSGAQQLADAVRLTLGPQSRSVLIEKKWGRPQVCDDGVTIAKEVELKDAQENMGAQMLREPAERTQAEVGDGTTTATLLAHAIFAEGVRNIVAGASAVELKRGIEKGSVAAISSIQRQAKQVKSKREKAQVATISAHGNTFVGELVADAIEKVGSDGVITVEEAKGTQTQLEVVEGLKFDSGYLSAYFVTDLEKMECVLTDVRVLFFDKKLGAMKPLVPLLEQVVQRGASLLIIAEDVEGEALATLVVNKVRGALKCVAAKAPGFGDRRKAMLEDMAILTGGQVISEELGQKLEQATVDQLGIVQRVVVTKDSTTLVGGGGAKRNIAARIEAIRREWSQSTSDYDKEKLQERMARLAGGVAVVRVGAASQAELKVRKDAFDDAVNATRAAVAEGVVPGAGLAFLRAIEPVRETEKLLDGDEKTGARIVRTALEVVTRTIAENAGLDPGVVVERMKTGTGAFGLNAATRAYGDLEAMGIIDPAKVLRLALENAVSSSTTLLLTDATLIEIPEPKPPSAAAASEAADFG
jgi:chaperonin GroEL